MHPGVSGKHLYLFIRYAGTLFEIYNVVQQLGDYSKRVCNLVSDLDRHKNG